MEDHHDDAGAPPSEMDVYLHEESRVLICSVCKGGIQPGPGIESHFRRRHGAKGAVLQRVREKATTAAATAGGLADPQTAETPADGTSPVPELRVQAGFSCIACRFLTTNEMV
ncbi:uncharacterized protein B0I36DRAFT_340088, partial [Microdochium trichocladiopsis]